MTFKKIPFDDVWKFIKRIFDNESSTVDFSLTPDSISKFADLSGIQLKWRPILNWENCFETNTYEYTDQDFLEIAFTKVRPSDGQTIIVTDECFRDKMAFSICYFKDMIHFMEIEYPSLFNMQFPQPSDFIFLQPGIDLITMIHHEGVRTKFCKT